MPKDITGLMGWISGVWQKNPLLFGLSDTYDARISDTDLDEGTNTLAGTVIPTGEICVLTSMAFFYAGTAPTRVYVYATIDSSARRLYGQESPASQVLYDRQGWWVLGPGDRITIVVEGATATDNLYLDMIGFTIDIDQ